MRGIIGKFSQVVEIRKQFVGKFFNGFVEGFELIVSLVYRPKTMGRTSRFAIRVGFHPLSGRLGSHRRPSARGDGGLEG